MTALAVHAALLSAPMAKGRYAAPTAGELRSAARAAAGAPGPRRAAAAAPVRRGGPPRRAVEPAAAMRVKRGVVVNGDEAGANPWEQLAMQRVASRLARRFPGKAFSISTPMVEAAGAAAYPITGFGPIEVQVAETGDAPRGRTARERTFVVMVTDGGARIVASQRISALARVWQKIDDVIPLRELVADLLRSRGARRGAGVAAVGSAIGLLGGPFGLVFAGGAVFKAAGMIQKGVLRRMEARKDAFEDTVALLKDRVGQGEAIAFTEAYDLYRASLESSTATTTPGGTAAISELEFARQLRTVGL